MKKLPDYFHSPLSSRTRSFSKVLVLLSSASIKKSIAKEKQLFFSQAATMKVIKQSKEKIKRTFTIVATISDDKYVPDL